MGVIDQATGQPVVPKKFICIPDGVVAQQATDIACKYLEDHPETRQSPAPILVYQACSQHGGTPSRKKPATEAAGAQLVRLGCRC
ncbi:Rap1a/Tai family immunity protein [Mesorhizobium carmichaelinearum]|uniref:Rap1a/Tai family immunity protein n=1 Tax=Mesorhizobium carmichaelinearum TaxID=1208188 RepID=UPI0034E0CBDB